MYLHPAAAVLYTHHFGTAAIDVLAYDYAVQSCI